MFTGIVEELGTVSEVRDNAAGKVFGFSSRVVQADAGVGDSIAVNGTCLTVTRLTDEGFEADVMAETLRATALGSLVAGAAVNLERPMRADGRFDGHIVQGHVDGVGCVRSVAEALNETTVWVDAPSHVLRYCVPKGSITLDGISLTIVDVDDAGFSVSIIPHTWQVTNLASRGPGDPVNLEADVLAKYVERLLPAGSVANHAGLDAGDRLDAGGGA